MMIYWLKMVIFRRYDQNGDFMGISPIKLETSWDIFIIGAGNNDWNLRIFNNQNVDFTSHSVFFPTTFNFVPWSGYMRWGMVFCIPWESLQWVYIKLYKSLYQSG